MRGIATAHLTDIGDSARLFALANLAGADALMSAWNTKRAYAFWRPSSLLGFLVARAELSRKNGLLTAPIINGSGAEGNAPPSPRPKEQIPSE